MIFTCPLNAGGGKQEPTTIVIHAMSEFLKVNGEVMHAIRYLKSANLSPHALITPSGDIILTRSANLIGWHAKKFNEDSLGVELLVHGIHDYNSFLLAIKEYHWTLHDQMIALADRIHTWCKSFNITQITGHSNLDPTRKKDPGSFDWYGLMGLLGPNYKHLFSDVGV